MNTDFGQSLEERVIALLENGQVAEGVDLATQSANSGDPEGMFILAQMYYRGVGLTQDAEMAVQWYKRAADAGDPEAMYEYAVFCSIASSQIFCICCHVAVCFNKVWSI